MRKLLIASLAATMSLLMTGVAHAEPKSTTTTLTLTPSTVEPEASYTAAGLVVWDASANANPNSRKALKSGEVSIQLYDTAACTGNTVGTATTAAVSNGIYSTSMTAPAAEGTYYVLASFAGKAAQGPLPALAASSACATLVVEEDGGGGGGGTPTVVCEVPAAPAVAAAWLKDNDPRLKAGSTIYKNVIARVAFGNEVMHDATFEYAGDTDWDGVPGWRVPADSDAGAGDWHPRCMQEGTLDVENNVLVLDANPAFYAAVNAYTEHAHTNGLLK
jgi:hypothetical protein